MQVSRKDHAVLRQALTHWQQQGELTPEQTARLIAQCEVMGFDWQRLAKYCFWLAVASFFTAVSAMLADQWLMALIKQIFNATDAVKCGALTFVAAGFYGTGLVLRQARPEKTYTNESLLFMGVLSTALAIAFLGKALDSGSGHFSLLLLLAAVVYCLLGLAFPSKQVWLFGLVSFGSWFGAETGYASGWGAYYLGMNYPLRFVLFGSGLVVAGQFAFSRWKSRQDFQHVSQIMGMLYLFIALWILSIFGNYGSIDNWSRATHVQLFGWSVLFAGAALAAIYVGIKTGNAAFRGFGITFIFINLYTRYFEYFWDGTHKAIFFSVLAISFWLLGSRAENIWTLQFSSDEEETPKDEGTSQTR